MLAVRKAFRSCFTERCHPCGRCFAKHQLFPRPLISSALASTLRWIDPCLWVPPGPCCCSCSLGWQAAHCCCGVLEDCFLYIACMYHVCSPALLLLPLAHCCILRPTPMPFVPFYGCCCPLPYSARCYAMGCDVMHCRGSIPARPQWRA